MNVVFTWLLIALQTDCRSVDCIFDPSRDCCTVLAPFLAPIFKNILYVVGLDWKNTFVLILAGFRTNA